MASQLARSHSHLSNRAKVRSALERKPVFKSVLETPFQISWPSVRSNVQNAVLAHLVAALDNVPPRNHSSRTSLQKTGLSDQQANSHIPEEADGDTQTNVPRAFDPGCADRVACASCLVIGINAVTKTLELQLRVTRKHVVDNLPRDGDQLSPRSAPSPIMAVFACCADIDPPALVDHMLYLVAGCNSLKNATQPIKLVPLPRGSEPTISQILGVRRAAVVAIRRGFPASETMRDALESVPTVSARWLCPSDTQGIPEFVPTHIKQLRTTAPKDMKRAREQRSEARAAAKKNMSNFPRSRRKPRVKLTTEQEGAT